MTAAGVETYREAFESVRAGLAGDRGAAFDAFAEKGFPTHRVENWKYTPLAAVGRKRFAPAAPAPDAVPPELPGLAGGERIVLVNGFLREDLSTVGVGRLDAAPAFGEDEPLMALNAAMAADGYRLVIDRAHGEPIEILHATLPDEGGPLAQSRNRILVTGSGSAEVIERHVGLGSGPYFVNGVTEVVVEEGGRLRHVKVQDEDAAAHHLWFMPVRLGRNAEFASMVATLGGALSRNQIDARLEGGGARLSLDGAYLVDGRRVADHTSRIEHLVPGTESRQAYRGAVAGRARAVFQGHVVVHAGADGTDGHQSHRALLLSNGAEVDAKPVLEIEADDVQCSHGATVGDLDDEALFYLRSRGIPEPAGRSLLVRAFLGEVLDALPGPELRAQVEERVGAFAEEAA